MSILKVTKENFEEVIKSDQKVLIDFYADWCGPCRTVSFVINQIAEENPDLIIGKINVSDEAELAARFGVSSIPTLAVFKNGELIKRSVGAKPKAQILELLK